MEKEKEAAKKQLNFNPVKFIKLCLSHWKLFAVSVAVFACIFGALAYFKMPTQQVEAQLMLKDDTSASSMMYAAMAQSFSLGDMFGMSSSTDNEVAVLQSHNIGLATARALGLNISYQAKVKHILWKGLYNKIPLRLVTVPNISDTLQAYLVFNVKRLENGNVNITLKKKRTTLYSADNQPLPCTFDTPFGPFTLEKTEFYDESPYRKFKIALSSYDGAAEGVNQAVKIFAPNRKTDFITLSYTTDDPDFGKLLLQTIIDKYNALGNDERNLRSSASLELVTNRLTTLSDEMAQTEQRLERFKLENNLTDVEVDAQFLLTRSTALDENLLAAQTENEILRLTLDFLNDANNNYSLIPDLATATGNFSSSLTESARSQISAYNELILERMRIATTARENNSSLQRIDEQLSAMRQNIIVSVGRALENSRVALREVQTEANRANARIGQLPTLERQYVEIRRIAELQNQMYMFLLQQKEQLSLDLATRSLSAATIDAPHVLVQPVGFGKVTILLLGIFLGFLLPAVFLFLRRMDTAAVTSEKELRNGTKTPVLGCLATGGDNIDSELASGANRDCLRRLRAEVTGVLEKAGGNTVLVTSVNPGEGKTYVAQGLAAAIAKTGKRVILINGNPVVENHGAANFPTLSVHTGANGYDIVDAGESGTHPADLLANASIADGIKNLEAEYDIAIVDAAPLRVSGEALDWAPLSTMTLVVVRMGKTSARDLAYIDKLREEGTLPRIAVTGNDAKC